MYFGKKRKIDQLLVEYHVSHGVSNLVTTKHERPRHILWTSEVRER